MTTNMSEFAVVDGHGDIAANDEAANNFTSLSLRLLPTLFRKTLNRMEIRYTLGVLFSIKFMHILLNQSNFFMLIYKQDRIPWLY